MAVELVMPRLGWTMQEGTLVEWLKQDGDRVEVGEIVFTVETEKALNEVEALDGGILRIPPDSPPPGTAVPVGTLLAYLVAPGEAVPTGGGAQTAANVVSTSSQAAPQSQPSVRQEGDGEEGPTISPRARRMAEAQGVDWRRLKGSGRGGRVVERDVEEAAALKQDSAPTASWRFTGVHHVGLTVRDLSRSVAFYRDTLGMALLRQRETDADYIGQQTGYPGVRLAAASFQPTPDSPQSLEVVQYLTHAAAASDPATNRSGNSHLCLTVDDIGAAFQALQAEGVRFRSDPVAITSGPNQGGYVVYLFDPDGYTIELFQRP